MKLRTLKRIITLVAAFAVLTTGAVSYAAWEGTTTVNTATVTTGQLKVLNFDSATTTVSGLLPYDQYGGAGNDTTDCITETIVLTVTETGDSGTSQKWEVTVTSLNQTALTKGGKLQYWNSSAWVEWATDVVVGTGTGNGSVSLIIRLVSNDVDEMNQSITIEFTLSIVEDDE